MPGPGLVGLLHWLNLLLFAAAAVAAAADAGWEELPVPILLVPQVPVEVVMMERSRREVVEREVKGKRL